MCAAFGPGPSKLWFTKENTKEIMAPTKAGLTSPSLKLDWHSSAPAYYNSDVIDEK